MFSASGARRLAAGFFMLLLAALPGWTAQADTGKELQVQAASDAHTLALRFSWQTTAGNFGLLHELMRFDSGKWGKVDGYNEDRLSLMIASPGSEPAGFAGKGCLAACHKGAHYVSAQKSAEGTYGLDLWHWRGARSAPMGYAEDTFVANGEADSAYAARKTDSAGTPPTSFLRKEGDRFRESMPFALAHTAGQTQVMLPEFVFDPTKNSGFYFLNDGKKLVSHGELAEAAKLYGPRAQSQARLQHGLVATGLAANALRTDGLSAEQKGEVARQVLAGGILPRNVMFDYGSDQHDIVSRYEYDPKTRRVTLTLLRSLDTGSSKDAAVLSLLQGRIAVLGVALHDNGATGAKHLATKPFTLGRKDATVRLHTVANAAETDWSRIKAVTVEAGKP